MQIKRPLKSTLVILLALILVALALPSMAEEVSFETTANVGFTDGTLEIVTPPAGTNGMDFNFGTHALPVTQSTYSSTNGPHMLRVVDAMEASGGWSMTARMSAFTNSAETSSFQASITLTNPSNASNANLDKVSPLSLVSGAGDTPVLDASSDLGRGTFDTVWQNDDAVLLIAQSQTLGLKATGYQADLTWTLSLVP